MKLEQKHIEAINNLILDMPTRYGLPLANLLSQIQQEQEQKDEVQEGHNTNS